MQNKVCNVEITNPDKLIYKADKLTKLDVVNYYIDIAPQMLPYIKDRPVSVIRCHDGIEGEKFFKKHPSTETGDIGKTIIDDAEYFCISTINQLITQVQMGTIEFHTWGCKKDKVERPDTMIFDLDPDENLPLDKLRQGVKNVKSVLDELGLDSNLKTSGGKGFHIIVPFRRNKTWEEFGDLAKQISEVVVAKWPRLYTTNIRKDQRGGKIFIDYLRNKRGASCVAPYSLRAREHAPISMPITWQQLDIMRPNQINLTNYKDFLTK